MNEHVTLPDRASLISYPGQLLAKGAAIAGPWDQAEVDQFVRRLCGLGHLSRGEMLNSLIGLTVPRDFRHLRIVALDHPGRRRAMTNIRQGPLDLREVMINLACFASTIFEEYGQDCIWHETIAMPIENPSRLELGIRFRPRISADPVVPLEGWFFQEGVFDTDVHRGRPAFNWGNVHQIDVLPPKISP
ncbi:hypothetical protein [Novosphingobium sp. JCM 18896]|uniref:hypothetical protein n=1 Tax=Novosphingobium sp. JCM 18896 TaxID=2989731 RepID=UPI0022236505|nr:hypothetical protein [Novosphingobium sp. JCM 18896]MCW1432416.1 hypothetical protein [Novosphingobium sp. JCM 18896]